MSIRRSGILTSKHNSTQPPTTENANKLQYFTQVLKEAGFNLIFDDTPNVITQEQSLVTRDIEVTLKKHEAYPNNLREFVSGLKNLCKNEEYFQKALGKTRLKKGRANEGRAKDGRANEGRANEGRANKGRANEDRANEGTANEGRDNEDTNAPNTIVMQESLIRMLLSVIFLQQDVVNIILDELTTVASEDNTSELRQLLDPLRYLSYIQDAKSLTTKLLDILEIATYPCQLEMLYAIPEILPDSQYDETAKQLSALMDSNPDLTGAIIDCLNSLSMSSDARSEVQGQILENIFTSSSLKIFPILLEFLVTDIKAQNLNNTLLKLRNALDTILGNESDNKEVATNKVLVLNKFRMCACIPKQLYEGWINMITAVKLPTDHKPVDFIILFILYSTSSSRKKVIEMLFRKRIKSGLFKTALLETMFKHHIVPQFLNDHLATIIDLATNILKMYNDVAMVDFASAIFKQLFTHRLATRLQRQDIIHSLILLTGSSESKTVTLVLDILNDISTLPKMHVHTAQLMGLLEKLDSYDFKAVKQVFNLLCFLTCSPSADDTTAGFKDEIHMLVRKLLSSAKKTIKYKGIISAVIMAKYVATTNGEQSDSSIFEDSILNISDLPRGPAQEAATILELANTSSASSPDLLGLFYDQLASTVVTAENLDKHFMQWLFETITNDFQDVFVTETIPDPINDIPITAQFSLNSSEEVEDVININIAELTLKPVLQERSSILVLAPLFRLLRLLHYQQNSGDLASIDALLGCGVIMPDLDDINSYDNDQIKQTADCIFHCINWFREVISAFVTQKNKKLRIKVLERLHHIVQLENSLQICLNSLYNHKLPQSYFHDTSISSNFGGIVGSKKSEAKSKPPKKKFRTNETVNDTTIASTSTQIPSKKTEKKSTKEIDVAFREVDTDIILLLKYPLKLSDDDEMPAVTQSSVLDIKQFQFLMKEFVIKLNVLTKNKNRENSNLSNVSPADLITDSARLLPCINRHFKVIVEHLSILLEDSEGRHDLPNMFTPEATDLKLSFGIILECISLIFGWTGFQHTKYASLHRECLRALRGEEKSQLNSANRMMVEFSTRMEECVQQCLYLPSGVHIVNILKSLYLCSSNPDIKKKVNAVSGKLLTKKWYKLNADSDSGSQFCANIDILVKSYLDGASTKTICGLVATLQAQAPNLQKKTDYLLMLASIDKSSFYILYRGLCVALNERVKIEITSLTNNEHLVLWKTTALTMQGLMTISKAQETRSNLLCFLKRALMILKIFLSQGIPIMEMMLKSKPDDVIEIFKTIQTTTRFLHHLCCTSKITKDSNIIAYVPAFRQTLETFIYRVKAALVANNCSSAFWMGNLRNRDLHGEDILSQSTVVSEDTRNSDDEIPDDESDIDMIADESSNTDGTASEIFE